MNIVHLGSQSFSRQFLLREAGIPFKLLVQEADETLCNWNQSLQIVVAQIARFKMENLRLPSGEIHEKKSLYVLTADTLSKDSTGQLQGKPHDRQDAIKKIRAARNGVEVATAFCLQKKQWHNNQWQTQATIERVVSATFEFIVPEEWIEIYLQNSLGIKAAGAIAIEGFGGQFLRSVQGSYTTIVGLPLYELREALEELNFF